MSVLQKIRITYRCNQCQRDVVVTTRKKKASPRRCPYHQAHGTMTIKNVSADAQLHRYQCSRCAQITNTVKKMRIMCPYGHGRMTYKGKHP